MPTWVPAVAFCIMILIVMPLTAWYYAGYFNGRWDNDN
jgi:hypothetical protein